MQVFKIFTNDELSLVRKTFKSLHWEDGKNSAHGHAKEIKNNRQAFPKGKEFEPILKILTEKFFKGPLKNIAVAKNLVGVRANSYTVGETYGWHVDFAHMAQKRTDMSFTIAISDKSEYEGGELEMEDVGRKASVKLEAGQMVLYPTGILHRVKPVTSGTRLCIVGWIESLIPSEERRTVLVNFNRSLNAIRSKQQKGELLEREEIDKLNQVYFQITRILTP
jgi:PKHD-type hydroxylase